MAHSEEMKDEVLLLEKAAVDEIARSIGADPTEVISVVIALEGGKFVTAAPEGVLIEDVPAAGDYVAYKSDRRTLEEMMHHIQDEFSSTMNAGRQYLSMCFTRSGGQRSCKSDPGLGHREIFLRKP